MKIREVIAMILNNPKINLDGNFCMYNKITENVETDEVSKIHVLFDADGNMALVNDEQEAMITKRSNREKTATI